MYIYTYIHIYIQIHTDTCVCIYICIINIYICIYSNSQIEKSWKPGNHGGDIIYDKLDFGVPIVCLPCLTGTSFIPS